MKNTFFPFLMVLLFFWSCRNMTEDQTKDLPGEEDLNITFELLTNFIAEEPRFRCAFTIENNSNYVLGNTGWELYFNMFTRLPVPGSVSPIATIEHINGDLYRLGPTDQFNLPPGESTTITADFQNWMIKRVGAPLGLYFVFYDENGSETGRVSVENYTIKPFTEPDQINRFRGDQTPIPSPEWRYDENLKLTDVGPDEVSRVIPSPAMINTTDNTIELNDGLMIHHQDELKKEAELLADMLEKVSGNRPMVMTSEVAGPNIISLTIEDQTIQGKSSETYLLSCGDQGIKIAGSDAAGVFYGIQSLIALLPVEAFQNPQSSITLPEVNIEDAPAFGYRGLHLDLARNFQKKPTVLKLIDIISFYKLNKLHLHLTDDEGWRLEIEELPELTSVGAFRGHTLTSEEYLPPAYGSGPSPDPETSWGSGYLSREDFKEIIRYAHDRHIEVIPEVNMPGHARAALRAMEARYRHLIAEGKREEAEEYYLTDPKDSSVYFSAQAYNDNVICVCKEPAYRFYETVVDDIIEMYEEAGVPLNYIHTGGDEVPRGAWEKSPICQEFLDKNPSVGKARDLQPYFFGRIVDILNKKGLATGGWEEVAMKFLEGGDWIPNEEFVDKDVVPYVWNSLWGNQDLAYKLANGGYPIVLCNVNNYYFDLAYNKDPEEPGLYWGGFVNTRNAFEFIPFDLFKSMTVSPMGIRYDPDKDFKGMERLSPSAVDNILGIQGQLWSETIKGGDMLEYYYLPKLLGLAERAWYGQAEWGSIEDSEQREKAVDEAWNYFANTVAKREFPRLDYIFGGYTYRIPLPGVKVIDRKVHANLGYPGMIMRYTIDGSDPDVNSAQYEDPFEASGTVKIKTFDTRSRSSRPSTVIIQ